MENQTKEVVLAIFFILLLLVVLPIILIFKNLEHKNTNLKTEKGNLERNSERKNTDRELAIFLLSKGKSFPLFTFHPDYSE